MRSFVIHMPSSTARRANADRLCANLPNAELFDAVNGRDPQQIAAVRLHPGTLHRPHYPFALRAAEIGVFESHRKIWRKMVEEDIDLALICEDDLQVEPDRMTAALKLLQPFATPDHYIRIPVKQREIAVQTLVQCGDLRLILPRVIGLQCVCQVVGQRAAKRLLAATDQIDRPIDTFLQMHWITGQPIHSLQGSLNQEVAAKIGGSTIQSSPPLSDKLTRAFKRATYRSLLQLHPQRAPALAG